MQGLDFTDAATQDTVGAARYLREHGAKRVGVMGFCMGGALAMLAAMQARRVRCRQHLVRPSTARSRRSGKDFAFRSRAIGRSTMSSTRSMRADALERQTQGGRPRARVLSLRSQARFLQHRRARSRRTRPLRSRVCRDGVATHRRVLRPHAKGVAIPMKSQRGLRNLRETSFDLWCQGPESNRRHRTFQARALPTELPWLDSLSGASLLPRCARPSWRR